MHIQLPFFGLIECTTLMSIEQYDCLTASRITPCHDLFRMSMKCIRNITPQVFVLLRCFLKIWLSRYLIIFFKPDRPDFTRVDMIFFIFLSFVNIFFCSYYCYLLLFYHQWFNNNRIDTFVLSSMVSAAHGT